MKKWWAIGILFFWICCTFSAQSQIQSIGKRGKTRAVVIGIADYENASIKDLEYADVDAQKFAEYLKSTGTPPENIQLLTNANARGGDIIAAFTWLTDSCGPGDKIIFYFSGHGDMETKSNWAYLLAYDASKAAYGLGGAFPLTYMQSVVANLTANGTQVIMITDACHAGKLAGDDNHGAEATANMMRNQFANTVKLLSCQPNQLSLENSELGGGRGVFSYYLIDGLTGLADDNEDLSVDIFELGIYLQKEVRKATLSEQTPIVEGDNDFEIARVDPAKLEILKEERSKTKAQKLGTSNLKSMEEPGDSVIYQRYLLFQTALQTGRLLDDTDSSAYGLYVQIKDHPDMGPYRGLMRLNLAAALQNNTQTALNDYLASDPSELYRRWTQSAVYERYPEYLMKAAELLGPEHFMYSNLVARSRYFEGLNLRLKAEKTQNTALYVEAKSLQIKALELDTNAVYAYNELGLIARRENNPQASIPYFQKALALSPTWVLANSNLCASYVDLDQFPEAYSACQRALQYDSTFSLAYYNLGIYYDRSAQPEAAIAAWAQAIHYDSSYYDAYTKLGAAYYYKGAYKQTEPYWLQCRKLHPQSHEPYYNLGQLYSAMGQKSKALEFFQLAQAIDPMDPGSNFNIAEIQIDQKNYSEAGNALSEVEKLYPDIPDTYYLRARLYAMQNKQKKALDSLEMALEKGFRDKKMIQNDPQLSAIRKRARFHALVKKYFP